MRPYALESGEGWTYRYGVDFTIKAGELSPGRGAAFTEYTTRKGEEPPDHIHPTEDEIFCVLTGELTFRCGGESFEVSDGGFIYLPQGLEHGYTIRSEAPVRRIVVSFPTRAAAGEALVGLHDLAVGECFGPCRRDGTCAGARSYEAREYVTRDLESWLERACASSA